MTNKITTKEAIMLILSVFVSHTITSMPQNLLENTKSATLINLIYVGILATFLVYFIYLLLKNFASLDLIDISKYLGGDIFKNIIGIFFIFYFILSSASLLREFCEALSITFFPKTNIFYIILPFILIMILNNFLSFKSNIKTVSIIFPIVLISIVFLFFGNFKHFSFTKMFPVLGDGFSNTFITGIGNIVAFGGISYLYFLPPHLKDPKKLKNICLTSVIVGLFYFLFAISTILLLFSFFIDSDKVLPLFSAARYIEFGIFFQRLEALFMLIWILEICCYLTIANQFSINIFQKICNLEFRKPIAFTFPLLILAISLIPKNFAIIRFLKSKVYSYSIISIVFTLGIGVLLLANYKKNKVGDLNK